MAITVSSSGTLQLDLSLLPGLVRSDGLLTIKVEALKYDFGGALKFYVGAVSQALTDDATNYVYLDDSNALQINTTGFPGGSHLPLAAVVAGSGAILAISDERAFLTRSPEGGGGGESNTASNVGAGSGVFKQKTGVTLELRSIVSTAPLVAAENTDDVQLTISAATSGVAGSMSAADKSKLNGVAASADVTSFANVSSALAAASAGVDLNAQALTGVKTASYGASGEVDNGDSGAAKTIDWGAGNCQVLTLTDNCTLTFTDPPGVTHLTLVLLQDATAGWSATWPASVKWSEGQAPTLTNQANAEDITTFYYRGAVNGYRGGFGPAFA